MKIKKYKKLFFATLLCSSSVFAQTINFETIKPCVDENYKSIYNYSLYCIGNEKIKPINHLDTYMSNNVSYKTENKKYNSILTKQTNTNLIWELVDKNNITFTFSKHPINYIKDFRITKIKNSSSEFNLNYVDSKIDFIYEKENDELLLKKVIMNVGNNSSSFDLKPVINTSNTITKSLTYNKQELLVREEINANNLEPRITKYEYNINNGNNEIKIINGIGQISIETYDSNANLISLKDPNGLISKFEYNQDNKLTKEIDSRGKETIYSYSTSNLIDNSTSKLIIKKDKKPTITIYLDNKNRKIRTETESFNSRLVFEDIIYDTQGRVHKYSMPYFKGEDAYFIQLTYDDSNRVIEIDKPGVNNTRVITTYTYNPDNTTLITFPDNKTKLINNDGTNSNIAYEYDLLGNISKTIDEKGRTVNFNYDILNRLTKKEIYSKNQSTPENVIYYVYDRANNGEGKLAYEKSKEYKKEYFYNEYSNISATKTYLGDKTFVTQYTYTPEGKLEKTINPDGFTIINEYNNLGYLNGIKSPKNDSSELDFEKLKLLITENLNEEYSLYEKLYDLKSKTKFYSLKKEIYTNLSTQYSSIDTEIQQQLIDVSNLLNNTIELLNKNIQELSTNISFYKKIRDNYLLPKAVINTKEEHFAWLNETFNNSSKKYVNLSTLYINKASSLLESIITNPELLNNILNIDKDLIKHYQLDSTEIITYADKLSIQSNLYKERYNNLKKGLGNLQQNAYLGMFDNTNFKYFYKVLDTDALGRITHEVYGNGLVTKKEYDPSSGNLLRIVSGYYGNNDIKDIKYTFDTNNNVTAMYDVKRGYTQTYKYNELNRLISASSIGENFYSNISYTYSLPYESIYTYDQVENKFINNNTNLSIKVTEPNIIEKGMHSHKTLFAADKKSYKKTKTENDVISTTYKINDNFKYQTTNDKTIYKNLIYVNNKLIAIHNKEKMNDITIPTSYYMHKDVFGSIDIITNQSAGIEKRVSYRPFGEKSDISWTQLDNTNDITNYGYKGYERDDFNLLNINGYIYDPENAKTLSDESIDILDEQSSEFFTYSSPTKHLDQNIEKWYKGFMSIFDMKKLFSIDDSLYNFEVRKAVNSLASHNNIYIGQNEPENKNLIWYKPNLKGGLDISINNNGQWDNVGETGSLNSNGTITASSLQQLNSMPCFYQDVGFIVNGSNKIPYTCSENQTWKFGGEFIGTFNVLDLLTKFKDAAHGSTVNVQISNSSYTGVKKFIKNNVNWIDNSNKYIITQNLNNVLNVNMQNNSFAYIYKNNATYYTLERKAIPNKGNKWTYIANDYKDVALNFDLINKTEGGYVFDKKNNIYFTNTNNVWSSLDNTKQISNSNQGRNVFTNLNKNYIYYLVNNDCLETNCYGDSSSSYYAGTKIDDLFVFNYVTTGKNKNSLVDLVVQNSLNETYTNQRNAVLLNNKVYFKKLDNKNRICYQREDGVYITKNGVSIPSSFVQNNIVNLPPNYNCVHATFESDQIVLGNYSLATVWADAPNNVKAKINNKVFTHRVNGNQDFWTDNDTGDGQQSATIIFTGGHRGNLPLITHSINALTKQLGSQARYTTDGVVSSIDPSFKQWYYSLSGTITNNMLDNPCSSLPASENWQTDFSKSQCYKNKTIDSGWKDVFTSYSVFDNNYYWNGKVICSSSGNSCSVNNTTYVKGQQSSFFEPFLRSDLYYNKIKRVQNIKEIKNFSEL